MILACAQPGRTHSTRSERRTYAHRGTHTRTHAHPTVTVGKRQERQAGGWELKVEVEARRG
eukprot:1656150-Rhodomonas_salina.1